MTQRVKKSRSEECIKRYVRTKGGVYHGSFAWPLQNASDEWDIYWRFKAAEGQMRADAVIGKRVFVYSLPYPRSAGPSEPEPSKAVVSTPEYAAK